jgi:NitT/TauT family transport system substrate-binding protein
MILDAAKSSIAEVIHDPRAAGRLVEKHELGLKASVAEAAIPRCNFVFQTAVESRNGIEAILSEFLKVSPASIGGKLPDAGFYGEF